MCMCVSASDETAAAGFRGLGSGLVAGVVARACDAASSAARRAGVVARACDASAAARSVFFAFGWNQGLVGCATLTARGLCPCFFFP